LIDVSEAQIKIVSNDNEGVNNALTTLFVMIVDADKHSNRKIKVVNISDYPKYEHRGLLVDVCRHFFSEAISSMIFLMTLAAKEEAKTFLVTMFQFLQNSDIDMGLSESEMQAMIANK
jgi:hypothetical protein